MATDYDDLTTYWLEAQPEMRRSEVLEAIGKGADLTLIDACLMRTEWIDMDLSIPERISRRTLERRQNDRLAGRVR